ncbi:Histone-lysine N-methyltransferase EZH2 [Toxocara canis]|uniref:Histone-lysine N-methyltransferase EZH2 n=1 Tax=Toxocara canis TaxID=6265 RepID=A0A0B2UP26_TOXCA|nr:Histone-lysine N-methyltransferase EZH2 [Toxocara canis]
MATPRMQYWTMTEMNVTCKDEKKLSHMPFMGDCEVDDTSFGEELLETFAEGIHGTRTGCGEIINDDILYKLLKTLFARHPEANKRLLYEAVHNQFPNKASVRELPPLYDDLKRRFEPQDPANEEKLLAGYIDGTAYSSFRLLRCPRCFNYDCMLHGFGSGEDQELPRRKGHSSTSSPYPCGPNCYKYALKGMVSIVFSSSNFRVNPDQHYRLLWPMREREKHAFFFCVCVKSNRPIKMCYVCLL